MAEQDPRTRLERFLERHLAARFGDALLTVTLSPPAVREDVTALLPPSDLDRSWLLLLEADRWLLDGEAKKEARGDHLVRHDVEALRPVLAAHVKSGSAGAFAVFVHDADLLHAKNFRAVALRLADRLGLERVVLGLPAGDDTRHLAVLMSSMEDLAAEAAEAWHAALRADG